MINRFHIRDPLLLIMTGKESKKNYFGSLCYLFIFAPYSISLSGHLRNPNKLCRQWVLKENFCVPKMVDYSPSYKIFIFQFHFMYIVISQSMRYQDTLKSMCAVFHKWFIVHSNNDRPFPQNYKNAPSLVTHLNKSLERKKK